MDWYAGKAVIRDYLAAVNRNAKASLEIIASSWLQIDQLTCD